MSSHITIARAEQTSYGCPTQWNAWTDGDEYLYLRFRHGLGTVQDEDRDTLAEFDTDDDPELDGVISLTEFARRAGLRISPYFQHLF
ncbi:hypothetical protein KGD82_13725 [Nocardiopsis eucommiae]|uniref:Uncharacterized protein n=1 Tax=Nocardiopsis eucommiae TaxID=2831970 RepID=A0A975LC00_9ACTN|nr:hypothetical protein KGD82_13725 [Nocardiopsis eucommiae]